MAALGSIELTLLVGQYAQALYLAKRRRRTLTETVRAWRAWLPDYLPTPHPSWRTTHWLRNNPWFEHEVIPELRRRTRELVGPA
jgi:uracil-DNA glycosylase